jgi:hypothetical protein
MNDRDRAPMTVDPLFDAARAGGRILTGHLSGVDEDGRVLFVPEGEEGAPRPVTIGLALPDGAVVRAARQSQRAIVLCTDDGNPRHVLVGLLRDRVVARARDARPGELEVEVDGETLTLSAQRQIELRCGKASLLLRRDGRVEIRGAHVVSASTGPNKVKGATVAIN